METLVISVISLAVPTIVVTVKSLSLYLIVIASLFMDMNQNKTCVLGGIGLLTAVHKDYFRVVNSRDLLFNDCGDRVAQLLHVELVPPYSQYESHQQVLIVNTHLLFPHDSTLSIVRLQQVDIFQFF